jgi:hypothetical protein
MSVSYDTGEGVYVRLLGTAEDANIRLERNNVRLDSTYITKTAVKRFRIINRSDIIVRNMAEVFVFQEDLTHTVLGAFQVERV